MYHSRYFYLFSYLIFLLFFLFIFSFNSNAQNLIVNGDFESGGKGVGFDINGFGYTDVTCSLIGTSSSGNYAFISNPNLMSSSFISSGDHTTGSGKMLVIDGNTTGGDQKFWRAGGSGGGVCGLTGGTDYIFSYWIRSVSNSVTDPSTQADIGIQFNNAIIVTSPSSTQAPLPTSGWVQIVYRLRATNNCVNIELFNRNLNSFGNDFAVDDFEFYNPLSPPLPSTAPPLKLTYSIVNESSLGLNDGSIVAYGTGGSGTYTFTLSGNASASNNTGIFTNLGPGNYIVTISDLSGATVTANSGNSIVVSTIINPNPNPLSITPSTANISCGASATLTASGGSTYTWTASPLDPSLITPNAISIIVKPLQTTTYTVSSAGSSFTRELIYNGDFSLGNAGFATDYKYLDPDNPSGIQKAYGIVSNPKAWYSSFANCPDKSGTPTGKMIVFDGSTSNCGNDKLWSQTVPVIAGKQYTLSYYIISLTNSNYAKIAVYINGVQLSPLLGENAPNNNSCSWKLVTYNWTATTTGPVEIYFTDLVTQSAGNDFAIDNISLTTISTASFTKDVTVTTTGVPVIYPHGEDPTCGCNGKVIIDIVGGTSPYTYSITSSSTTVSSTPLAASTYTFDNQCADTYTVSVKDVNGCTSSPFTPVGGNCPQIQSILVDACAGSPSIGNEEDEEMVFFQTGSNPLNLSSSFSVNWPNGANPWQGLCTKPLYITNTNLTITGGGSLDGVPTSGTIPANSNVVLITSNALSTSIQSFKNLKGKLYVLFQCSGNTAGHFANTGTGIRTLTMNFGSGCTDIVSYDRALLLNSSLGSPNGAYVNFTSSGTASYYNYGCTIPYINQTDKVTLKAAGSVVLKITDPPAVCSPNTVNIEVPAITSGSTPNTGLMLTYFTDAAATIPLLTPNAINTSGKYYIKGTAAGCSDLKEVNVTVNPDLPASVSIVSDDADNTICTGTAVKFTASPTNGGTLPTYQWKINGIAVIGETGVTFTTSTLANDDVVTVEMTSNATPCLTGSPANSNSITISVNQNPTVNPGFPLSPICQGATSVAMGGSVGGGATGGTWSGGTGTWTNANDPATATYKASSTESGTITLKLTSSGGSCGTKTDTKTITIVDIPSIPILSKNCLGGPGEITVTSPLGNFEYSLDGGTYQSSTTFNNVANGPHTIIAREKTALCLSQTATETLNCGCLNPPSVSFDALTGTSGSTCQSSAITLGGTFSTTASNSVTVTHNGKGTLSGTLSALNITTSPFSFTYTPGVGDEGKSVEITVETDAKDPTLCSSDKIIYTLSVLSLPTASVSAGSDVCPNGSSKFTITGTAGATVSYTLDGGATTQSAVLTSGSATVPLNNISSNQTILLTSAAFGGCPSTLTGLTSSTATVTVLSNEAATFNLVPQICINEPAPPLPPKSMEAIEGSWNPSTISNQNTGTYTFTPKPIPGRCFVTTLLTVTVNKNPVEPEFDLIPPVCINTTNPPELKTESNNKIKGTWQPSVVSTQFSGETTYTFTPTPGQCAATTTLKVKVAANPVVDAGPPRIDILVGESVKLNGVVLPPNAIYKWTPDQNISNDEILEPIVNPTTDVTYTLTATTSVSEGSCVAKDEVLILVLKDLIVPNVFSPNGDGTNDKFIIENIEKYKDATVDIFNRYGQQLIRFVGGYTNPWDGKVNGKDVPVGTYFYVITPNAGKRKVISGSISIVR